MRICRLVLHTVATVKYLLDDTQLSLQPRLHNDREAMKKTKAARINVTVKNLL